MRGDGGTVLPVRGDFDVTGGGGPGVGSPEALPPPGRRKAQAPCLPGVGPGSRKREPEGGRLPP